MVAGSQNCSSGVADQKEALTAWANHLLAVKKDEFVNKKAKKIATNIYTKVQKNGSHTYMFFGCSTSCEFYL
jgi:hypothetical protein